MLILTDTLMVAMRDPNGFRPLCIGKLAGRGVNGTDGSVIRCISSPLWGQDLHCTWQSAEPSHSHCMHTGTVLRRRRARSTYARPSMCETLNQAKWSSSTGRLFRRAPFRLCASQANSACRRYHLGTQPARSTCLPVSPMHYSAHSSRGSLNTILFLSASSSMSTSRGQTLSSSETQ